MSRGLLELKLFFRQRDSVVFTFSLPIVMLALLGSIFKTSADVFTGGMLAAGVASTTFISLGVGIAQERDDGTLKRLRGTPLEPLNYFFGKVVLVAVIVLAELAVMLTAATVFLGLRLPTAPQKWLTLGWVLLLGVAACSVLGVAASSLPRTARSATAVMHLPYLVLSFISGVFVIPLSQLPQPLIQVASLFPLRWMAQGFRSVFLPDSAAAQEVIGSWEHGRIALILAAWVVGGVVLCLTTFRWRNE